MEKFDSHYWNELYLSGDTLWDMGHVSPPLQAYIDQLEHRDLRILIPGGGNSYEAAYLYGLGFNRITVLDIAPVVVKQLQASFAGTGIQVLEEDFFLHRGKYDLVLEQTFFCALAPLLRSRYVQHMHTLIQPGGHLAGVLFNRSFPDNKPPFGGTMAEYEALFSPWFDFKTLAVCYNSHPARQDKELFINFIPKQLTNV